MAEEIDPADGIGPYAVPTRERINSTALGVVAHGGELHEGKHRSQKVDYADDPETLRALRKNPVGRNWTCSCGEHGVVAEVPAEGLADEDFENSRHSVRPKGPLRFCIRCDAGHLMPRFAGA